MINGPGPAVGCCLNIFSMLIDSEHTSGIGSCPSRNEHTIGGKQHQGKPCMSGPEALGLKSHNTPPRLWKAAYGCMLEREPDLSLRGLL